MFLSNKRNLWVVFATLAMTSPALLRKSSRHDSIKQGTCQA
jgi:hypothetical protein